MNNKLMGVVITGILPAVAISIANLMQKEIGSHSSNLKSYMLFLLMGMISLVIFLFIFDRTEINFNPGFIKLSFLSGVFYALSYCLIVYGFYHFKVPVSVAIPLVNTSALLTAIGGMVFFNEWDIVNIKGVFIGACLIVIGSFFIANSYK